MRDHIAFFNQSIHLFFCCTLRLKTLINTGHKEMLSLVKTCDKAKNNTPFIKQGLLFSQMFLFLLCSLLQNRHGCKDNTVSTASSKMCPRSILKGFEKQKNCSIDHMSFIYVYLYNIHYSKSKVLLLKKKELQCFHLVTYNDHTNINIKHRCRK